MLDPEEDHANTEWERGICVRQWFSLTEAAYIIEGIHPSAEMHGRPIRVIDMQTSLIETMHELEQNPDGSYSFSHQSFADWCNRRHLDWPLRTAPQAQQAIGTVDSAKLAQRLAEAELKAEQLAQELATITAERDTLSHELQGLTNELVSAKKDAAKSKADLQEAEADLLRGKSRGTMLRLVGGMASLCGVAIHGERIDGLKYITEHLDMVGVSVGDDTTRKILREAAQLIPPPKPRQP